MVERLVFGRKVRGDGAAARRRSLDDAGRLELEVARHGCHIGGRDDGRRLVVRELHHCRPRRRRRDGDGRCGGGDGKCQHLQHNANVGRMLVDSGGDDCEMADDERSSASATAATAGGSTSVSTTTTLDTKWTTMTITERGLDVG